MTGQESAQIIYQNDANALSDYIVSHFHPTGGEGGTNVYTLSTAVVKVPQDIRKIGMTCTFLSSGGWQSYKYIGTTAEDKDWETTDNWMAVPTQKEIGSESTSEPNDGSVWGRMISIVDDLFVQSGDISKLEDRARKSEEDILKLNEDMDNAYTQNGFLFSNSGRIDVFFNSDSGSIVFPSRMKLSYANIMIDVLDQPQLSIAYGSNTYFLVFDLSDRHLKLGNYNDQMSNTVLLGWIDTVNKIAIINASIVRVNMRSANPSDYLLKTEVIDDLTGTEKDEALSANMGRILSTQNAMMQYTAAGKYVDVNFSSTDTSVTVTLPSGLSLSYGNTRISESSSTEGTVLTDNMSNGRIKYLVYDLGTNAYKLVNFDEQMNNSILVGWINQYLKEAILKCDRYRVDGVSQSPDDYIQKSDIVNSLVTNSTDRPLSAKMGNTLTNIRGHLVNKSADYPKVTFSTNNISINWGGGEKVIVKGNTTYEIDTPPVLNIALSVDTYGFIIFDSETKTFKYNTLSNSLVAGTIVGEINGLNKTCILYTDIWEVDGKRMNPTDYISTSDIVHDLTTTDKSKVLGADQAGVLATQNGMMHIYTGSSFVSVNFSETDTSVTISLPRNLLLSYGNTRIGNSATDSGQEIIDPMTDDKLKYLVYDLTEKQYKLVRYLYQMSGNILVGWVNTYLKEAILLCNKYLVNGIPNSNNDLAEIAYDNIPTTVIQLKKNSDEGFISMVMTSPLIDSEINITGGYVSLSTNIGTETSVKIKKGVSNKVYFKCIDPFAVIEAKGVYNITNDTQNNNCYVIGNVRDFGEGATHISLASNNNVTGEIKDFNRKMTYILINSGTFSNPKLSGKLEDLPRLLTYLRLTSAGISITGNVSDLPRKLTYMYFNTGSTIDMSGDVSDLPRSLEQIILYGLTDIFTGDVSDFPRGLINVMLVGSNYIISGNVSDLPPNLDTLQISGASTVSGNILDLPRRLRNLYLVSKCNLKGSLADLPKNINYLSFQSTDSANPITGDISDIPNKKVAYLRLYQNLNITFNGELPMSDQVYYFQLQPSEAFPIDSATVDNILIKLAAIAGERTGTRTIDLTGACAAPTEASQSAIESLQQKGFTVTTNK